MSDKSQSTDSQVLDPQPNNYPLSRTLLSSTRLNYQYYLWKDTLDFTIHPSIPFPHPEAVIADVGTGTGIWLLDMLKEHPNSNLTVHGLDISLEQLPHSQSLNSSQTTFQKWDFYNAVEPDMLEKFDIVHIRLLGLAVQSRDGDTYPIFENIFKMLKPGGHVQWEELDERNAIITSPPNASSKAWTEFTVYQNQREGSDWPSQLPTVAYEKGFIDNRTYHHTDRPEMGRAQMECALMFLREYLQILSLTGTEEEVVKWEEMVREAEKEVLEGTVVSFPKLVFVARKPVRKGGRNTTPPRRTFVDEIPGHRLNEKGRELFKTWSGLEGEELLTHLHKIRDTAWKDTTSPYPCIGTFLFASPGIYKLPSYPTLLQRSLSSSTPLSILDIGCCFGQNLRALAASGMPTSSMYASDLKPHLWSLGYELFRDREKMHAQFIQSDILDPSPTWPLHILNGKIDVIIACLFLHLFNWDQQFIVLKRMVELSREGTVVMGGHIALISAALRERPWRTIYLHSPSTFHNLWRLVSRETNTEWKVDISLVQEETVSSDTTVGHYMYFEARRLR